MEFVNIIALLPSFNIPLKTKYYVDYDNDLFEQCLIICSILDSVRGKISDMQE